ASSAGAASPATIVVSQAARTAAMTAMPPPGGVGAQCKERSFGRSSTAARRSSGISAQVPRQAQTPATMAMAAISVGEYTIQVVVPAKAGTHRSTSGAVDEWVPAFAG